MAIAMYSSCRSLSRFIRLCILPRLHRRCEGLGGLELQRAEVIAGQYNRLWMWMMTLAKLKGPYYFQAAAAAARGIYEVDIDLVLLTDKPELCAVVLDWEESRRMQDLEALSKYFEQTSVAPPGHLSPVLDLYRRNCSKVNQTRLVRGWHCSKRGKKVRIATHPSRWTNRDLRSDATVADKLQKDYLFEYFYVSEMGMINATLHGSAQTFRHLLRTPQLHLVGGRHYGQASDLALFGTWRVLGHFDLLTPNMIDLLERLERRLRGGGPTRRELGPNPAPAPR